MERHTPGQDRLAIANTLGETKTLSLSGPILKDKLWFAGSYFKTDHHRVTGATTVTSRTTGSGPAGTNLNGPGRPQRRLHGATKRSAARPS
ncbi:MAG: hypothetical protein IPN91_06045 [Holophagaceae bacterium]|uniref:Uncharacterized protein n=1 Tax=Candidatus Geothrix odensensis TaxID=2954440 RepID=A0A936F128_9BACT|nr:hypothetical protein [Candidatus Geothrix odensensis]